MMGEPTPRWFPWRPKPRRELWVGGPVTLLVMVLGASPFAPRALLIVLPAALLVALLWRLTAWGMANCRRDRPRGYRLDAEGLTRVERDGSATTLPYADVHLVVGADHVEVKGPPTFWRLDDHVEGWYDLAHCLSLAVTCEHRPEDPGPFLLGDEALAWLSLDRESALVCQEPLPRRRGWLLAGLSTAMAILGWGLFIHSQVSKSMPWLLAGGVALMLAFNWAGTAGAVLAGAYRRRIRATDWGLIHEADGLATVVQWDELCSLEPAPPELSRGLNRWRHRPGEWLVIAETVGFYFHPADANADRLEHAIRQALAAPEAGRYLLRLGRVPDGAVSRAEAPPVAEGALSSAGEGGHG